MIENDDKNKEENRLSRGPLFAIMGLSTLFALAVIPFFPNRKAGSISHALPFMPTTTKKQEDLVALIRTLLLNNNVYRQNRQLKMVDLGSGDGRIVFECAKLKDLFSKCIGVEQNATLYLLSLAKLLLSRSETSTTSRIEFFKSDF